MKKIAFILIACLMPLAAMAMAQKGDVVYLNNGNIVSGKIVEKKINGDIKIETKNGTLEYSQFDYFKIEENARAPRFKEQRRYVAFEDRTRRLHFFAAELSAGATIETDMPAAVPVQFSVVNGLRLSEFLGVGVGIGVRYYGGNDEVRYLVEADGRPKVLSPWAFPIYADLRGNFVSHKGRNLVPYWSLDVGYTLGDRNFYFSPTVGVSIGGMRNNVIAGLFYMGQFVKKPFETRIENHNLLDGLGVKVGFQF